MSSPTTSIVEETLRSQRSYWGEISDRVAAISGREFPFEPPKRILLFGLGSSHFAARLSGYALMRDKTKPRIPLIACASTSIGHEVIPAKGDWAFAISHRGKKSITLDALELCDRAGAFSVLVSGRDVPKPEFAKHHLETVPQERVEPHTTAMTGAICAVTTLLIGAKATEEWHALQSIGDPDVEVFRKRAGQGPTCIIGEWEGEWLAREGALKLMEMARLPVRSYSSEEYFHGPFKGAPAESLWHVALSKDPRSSDIQAAHTIGVFGSSPLAWVPALVELQWLSLAVALNRGVDPDSL